MTWLLRFLAWATLLALPCWLVSRPYQRGLGAAAGALLVLAGHAVEVQDVQLQAPFDLGIFAAMCLATRRAPRRERARALGLGLPLLAALEALTVAVGIGLIVSAPARREAQDWAQRLSGYALETVPWVSAAFLWLALLGAWELRRFVPSGRAPARRRPAGGGPRGGGI
jgi:hypothetical protein